MNTDLETIENYLTGQLTPDERLRFEEALRTDSAVAEALTFYMLTKQVSRDEAREQVPYDEVREQRRAELDALRKKGNLALDADDEDELIEVATPVRTLWSVPMRWAAAASVILVLGLGWYFVSQPTSTPAAGQLADQYIASRFTQLPTTMDGGSSGSTSMDSLKLGVGLFNQGNLAGAETVFYGILTRQPDLENALKYAGIVSLRQGKYDQAIEQFHRLSQRTELYSNPGTFYEALAHLKRGQPTDQEQAKKLLNEVVGKSLEGKREAESLLKELNKE